MIRFWGFLPWSDQPDAPVTPVDLGNGCSVKAEDLLDSHFTNRIDAPRLTVAATGCPHCRLQHPVEHVVGYGRITDAPNRSSGRQQRVEGVGIGRSAHAVQSLTAATSLGAVESLGQTGAVRRCRPRRPPWLRPLLRGTRRAGGASPLQRLDSDADARAPRVRPRPAARR